MRGRTPREYPPDIVDLVCGLYLGGLTVREVAAVAPKGYRVQTILERYLPQRRPLGKRDQRGPKNHAWKGDACGYQAAHLRLGDASQHRCVDCGGSAHEWSYLYGCPEERRDGRHQSPYCTHPEHYSPRCRSCHKAYDRGSNA